MSEVLTGMLGTAAIVVFWVAVQNAWRKTFPDAPPDACGRCGHCLRREEQ